MPEINVIRKQLEELETYTVKQENQLSDVNGVGFVLEHNKTKAKVSVVVNDDDNKAFAIGFRTPPTNSKGIQHIVEHTVLCGSKKYPAKDPFVELAKGSLNTFLNAMTYGDKTVYPIASCNDKDFRNLMDVYLDAVFNPNIYSREEIFKQEGWHYELADKDSDIIINGVVYNEMRGIYSSPDALLVNAINQQLYPDSVYSVDSGGNPDVIPDLTREEYLDYHKNYYHPSNSYIYLYGDINPAEQLDYIDKEYLSGYDYLYVPSEIPVQKSFDAPISYTAEYSVTDEEELEQSAILTYNVVVGDSTDKILTEAMNILQFILIDSPGAPLKKTIIDSGICSDVESQYDSTMRQPMFTILARDANESDEAKFIEIIESELRKYVENGLDKRALEAAVTTFEFRAKELSYGRFPKGISLGLDSFETWLYDDEKVQDKFTVSDVYKYLREGINKSMSDSEESGRGYFEELIETRLLNNNHKAYVKIVPKIGINKEKDEALAAKLKEYKESLSEEEIDKLVVDTAHLKEYQLEPSTQEELEKIPLLSISDIRKEIKKYPNEVTETAGVPTYYHDLFTNGVSYLDILFRFNDVAYEDLGKAELLIELLKYVDTDEHTYNELSTEINLNTGGMLFNVGCMLLKDDKLLPYAQCKVKTFDDKITDGIGLIKEVLTKSHITDKKRIREIVSEIKAQGKNALVEAGHVTTRGRAASYIFKNQKIMDELDGVGYYRFIDNLDKNFEEEYEGLAADLERLYRQMFRRDAMFLNYTSKQSPAEMGDAIEDLCSVLSDEEVKDEGLVVPLEVKNEGFKTSSKVQYVATAANYKKAGLEYTGALNVLQIIFSYDYLWLNVRVTGGAYGAMCDFLRSGFCFMASYRDPNLLETYKIYKDAYKYVESFDCSDRDMTKYIIGTIAKLDNPMPPAVEGTVAFGQYMAGVSDEERQKNRDDILNCTQETIRSLAPYVKALSDSDIICAVGSEEKITEAADAFGEVTKLY